MEKKKILVPNKSKLKKFESIAEASSNLSQGTYTGTAPVANKRKVKVTAGKV